MIAAAAHRQMAAGPLTVTGIDLVEELVAGYPDRSFAETLGRILEDPALVVQALGSLTAALDTLVSSIDEDESPDVWADLVAGMREHADGTDVSQDRRVSIPEVARQTRGITAVLAMAMPFMAGDLDGMGRQLGKAIDALPELEVGLLMAVAGALAALESKTTDRGERVRVETLHRSVNARYARLIDVGAGDESDD